MLLFSVVAGDIEKRGGRKEILFYQITLLSGFSVKRCGGGGGGGVGWGAEGVVDIYFKGLVRLVP